MTEKNNMKNIKNLSTTITEGSRAVLYFFHYDPALQHSILRLVQHYLPTNEAHFYEIELSHIEHFHINRRRQKLIHNNFVESLQYEEAENCMSIRIYIPNNILDIKAASVTLDLLHTEDAVWHPNDQPFWLFP